ncbi:hypothetical protein D9757_013706 [Collybiopsis confluens]|uniref:Uncharacterized protein n=1 Tax=Collybiopsis confluens TaxID=2823264 RepID=A0A8H5D4Q5_9AGAR|nr:hypothetical protein D9757_013706 [Collybiopsis confluens]
MLLALSYLSLALASVWVTWTRSIPHIEEFIMLKHQRAQLAISHRSGMEYSHKQTKDPTSIGNVILPFEETVHYGTGDSVSRDEWFWGFPQGGGWALSGDSFETGYFSMYHELHCLEAIAIKPWEEPGHTGHCLTIMRQSALCEPDLTLERGDFVKRDFELDREGPTRMCKDWEAVRTMATRKWNLWEQRRKEGK